MSPQTVQKQLDTLIQNFLQGNTPNLSQLLQGTNLIVPWLILVYDANSHYGCESKTTSKWLYSPLHPMVAIF